jgi:excisionase family DNA binding protein
VVGQDVQQQDTAAMKSNDSELGTRPTCTVAEAADALGVSVGTVYKLLKTGKLGGYAVGRRRIVFADSVAAFQRGNAFQAIVNDAGRDEPGLVSAQPLGRPSSPRPASPSPIRPLRHLG